MRLRQKERELYKEKAKVRIDSLKSNLIEDSNGVKNSDEKVDRREAIQRFVKNNCVEPIAIEGKNVETIIWFRDLVQLLIKSAEEEGLYDVKMSIERWDARNPKIYKLPVYEKLIENWFILPPDYRDYKKQYHLWIDYNVMAGTPVNSMYDWKVVESWLDGWLWHKVIIEHKTPAGTFYSLYGHLWKEGLISELTIVKKWDIIWKVWKAFTEENGEWQEHLHFQIMEARESKKWYSYNPWEWNYDVLESFGKK